MAVDELGSAADTTSRINRSALPIAALFVKVAAFTAALAAAVAEAITGAGLPWGTHFIFVTTLVGFERLSLTELLLRTADALTRPWVEEAPGVFAAATCAVGRCLVQAVELSRHLPNAEVHPKRPEAASNECLERLAAGTGCKLAEDLIEAARFHAAPLHCL